MEGVEALQERSADAFHSAIERYAPGPRASILAAAVGSLLFWTVAAWPLGALYLDFLHAAQGTLNQSSGALRNFPTPSLSLVLTTALLGVLPSALWLLILAGWWTRAGRLQACAQEIRVRHEEILGELHAAGLLRLQLQHRDLDASRLLLAG